MMGIRYRVVFLGLNKTEQSFIDGMSKLGVSPVVSGSVVKKAPVILKEDLSGDVARKYADAVQSAGGKVNIIKYSCSEKDENKKSIFTIEPMENFTMCPQCGYKQLKAGFCSKCGLALS